MQWWLDNDRKTNININIYIYINGENSQGMARVDNNDDDRVQFGESQLFLSHYTVSC